MRLFSFDNQQPFLYFQAPVPYCAIPHLLFSPPAIPCYSISGHGFHRSLFEIHEFQYSFQKSDTKLLEHLYVDYVQKSDLDLILDHFIQLPTDGDDFFITNLDIINTINEKNPNIGKKMNNVILGKMMAERGFKHQKKGKNRETCYIIHSRSRIIGELDNHCRSFDFNHKNDIATFWQSVNHQVEQDASDLPF